MYEKRQRSRFDTGRVSYLKLDNYYFPLVDISEGGFLAEMPEEILHVGDIVDVEITISDRHGSTTFSSSAEIIRIGQQYVAGKWDLDIDHLTGSTKQYFNHRYQVESVAHHHYTDVTHVNG